MSNLNVRELRDMTDKEIADLLEDQREAMFNLRFQKGFGQLEDPNAIKAVQRDIARLLTVQRERQIKALGDAYVPPRKKGDPKSHLIRQPKKKKELKKGDTLGK